MKSGEAINSTNPLCQWVYSPILGRAFAAILSSSLDCGEAQKKGAATTRQPLFSHYAERVLWAGRAPGGAIAVHALMSVWVGG